MEIITNANKRHTDMPCVPSRMRHIRHPTNMRHATTYILTRARRGYGGSGVPTRYTHKWDGLRGTYSRVHTQTHTNTHKHTQTHNAARQSRCGLTPWRRLLIRGGRLLDPTPSKLHFFLPRPPTPMSRSLPRRSCARPPKVAVPAAYMHIHFEMTARTHLVKIDR